MGGRGWETRIPLPPPLPPPPPRWIPFENIAVNAPIPGPYVESVKSQKNQNANVELLQEDMYQKKVVDLLVRIRYSPRKKHGTACNNKVELFQIQHKALRTMQQRRLGVPIVECGFRFGRQMIFCALDRLFHRGTYRAGPNPSESDIGHEYIMLNQMWLGEDTINLVAATLSTFPPTRRFLGNQFTALQLQDLVESFRQVAKFIRRTSVILYTEAWARQNGGRGRRTERPNSYVGRVTAAIHTIASKIPKHMRRQVHKTTFENANGQCRQNIGVPDNAVLLLEHERRPRPRKRERYGDMVKRRTEEEARNRKRKRF